MKERISQGMFGDRLEVYPFLPHDALNIMMAASGRVEALSDYDSGSGGMVWGVKVNCTFSRPMTRDETNVLKAAIDRCWQWIGEQPAENQS